MSEEIETRAMSGNFQTQWVDRIKRLDEDAWDVMLRNHAGDLRRDIAISLRKRGLSEELVDDIEQETWLTAVRKIAEFVWVDEDKFYRWLRAISLNHIYSRHSAPPF